MVRPRLGGRIGRIGRERRILPEQAFRTQGSVNFVGRDVQEAKIARPFGRHLPPIAQRRLQQHIGAHQIGLDEIPRPVDRPVDMALGGQMHDGVRLEFAQRPCGRLRIADVGLEEGKPGTARDRRQRRQIAGIGKLVVDEYVVRRLRQNAPHDRRTDKAGAAGHQDTL